MLRLTGSALILGAVLWLLERPTEEQQDTIIRTDSQLIANQCSHKWKCHDKVLKKYHQLVVKGIEKYTKRCSIRWLPREQNFEADALSRSLYTDKVLDVIKKRHSELVFGKDDITF